MRRQRVQSILKWTALVFAVLIIGSVLFLAFFDWNAARVPLANFIGKRIDRHVEIGGIQAKLLSFTPHISVTGLQVGQPAWVNAEQKKTNMVEVNSIAVDFKLLPLFIGNLTILNADIDRPQVNLLRTAAGRANWQFGDADPERADAEPLDLPVIRNFKLRGGKVVVTDEIRKLRFAGTIAAGERDTDIEKFPFRLLGAGSLNARDFKLDVKGGPLINVERDKPYAFDADVRAGSTRLSAVGSIARAFDFGALQAALEMSGDDLASLYDITGLALPNTPPYRVKGRLRRDHNRLLVDDFNGKVGDSDIGGDVAIDLSGERPLLRGDLVSKSLDLDDLAAPLGAPPAVQNGETASKAQRQKNAQMASMRRLFPDARLQVERVRAMDADVKYRAQAVSARRIPLREVSFHVKLKNGVINVDPVSFVLPQGRFAGNVRIDASGKVPKTDADFRITGVQLEQFHGKDASPALEGSLVGRIKLSGEGDSVLKLVSGANGSVTAVVPDGRIREAFAELTGINLAKGLGLLLTKDQQKVDVRCGIADFKLADGKLSAQNLVFDTENVLITGKGDLLLAEERADLTIKGQPKKLRLFRVRAPITVKGPLRKPRIGIEGEKTLAQTGAAAAIGAVLAPLAAVIAFVDTGLAKDANCSALLAEARSQGVPASAAMDAAARAN